MSEEVNSTIVEMLRGGMLRYLLERGQVLTSLVPDDRTLMRLISIIVAGQHEVVQHLIDQGHIQREDPSCPNCGYRPGEELDEDEEEFFSDEGPELVQAAYATRWKDLYKADDARHDPEHEDWSQAPTPKLHNLTAREVADVYALVQAGNPSEMELPTRCLFLAELFTRIKFWHLRGMKEVPIPRSVWESCADRAGSRPGVISWEPMRDLMLDLGILKLLKKAEMQEDGSWHAATYELQGFEFDVETPSKPVYLKSVEYERRWHSFKEAAAGRDGRALDQSPSAASRKPR